MKPNNITTIKIFKKEKLFNNNKMKMKPLNNNHEFTHKINNNRNYLTKTDKKILKLVQI